MAGELTQLLYASCSRIDTAPGAFRTAIGDILASSAQNNHPARITGALVYDRGRFLQWLEGPGDEVDQLFRTIARDRRHRTIKLVVRRTVTRRTFAQWRMAFVHVGETAAYRLADDPAGGEAPEQLEAFVVAAARDASALSVQARR